MTTKSAHTATSDITVPALLLQDNPPVYSTVINGNWLLEHTTPSWRLKDPKLGFQRIVNESRAKQIARTVLDRKRAFPNAITLASNVKNIRGDQRSLILPDRTKFLVVDGQHRLWAQRFSSIDTPYACIVHLDKTEQEMAELFLEINDNQRKVPSSLRWDLVRLVRPTGDEAAVTAAEIVYELATREDSPFYFSIDLTGENKDLSVKQGSLAPEIKTLVSKAKKKHDPTFEEYVSLLIRFFSAVRSLDPNGWGDVRSTYYKARVLRALVRVLADIAVDSSNLASLTAEAFLKQLRQIDPTTLSDEKIRAAQGSAGVTDLYSAIKAQVL